MLRRLIVVAVAFIAVVLLMISFQPSTYRVSRTSEIHAPPEVVFAILNDLRQGARWSPFEKTDPELKRTFEGPETGVGSSMAWDGNRNAGAGKLTIEESNPNDLIRLRVDFTRPIVATNQIRYELSPTDQGTSMTWVMEGHNDYFGKVLCMFMDMDFELGRIFVQGMRDLDQVAQEDLKKQVQP